MKKKDKDINTSQNFISVWCNIDQKTFMRFAMFDTYRLKKYWKGPCLVSLVVLLFAVFCFVSDIKGKDMSSLGIIFSFIALAIPVFYFLIFRIIIKKGAQTHALSRNKAQYSAILRESGFEIIDKDKKAECPWDYIDKAFLDKNCIYIYLKNEKSYLLPQYENDGSAWKMIESHLGQRAKIVKNFYLF